MIINEYNNNVEIMRGYLSDVYAQEKYKYIWTESLNNIERSLASVNTYRQNANNTLAAASAAYANADPNTADQKRESAALVEHYRKKTKLFRTIALSINIAVLLLCFVVMLITGSFEFSSAIMLSAILSIPFWVMYGTCSSRGETQQSLLDNADAVNEATKQQVQKQSEDAKRTLAWADQREQVLLASKKEYTAYLKRTEETLQRLYAMELLPEFFFKDGIDKLTTAGTLLGYLENLICDKIAGDGGIYATYQRDLWLGRIIQGIEELNRKLDCELENQLMLKESIREANRTISCIEQQISGMSASVDQSRRDLIAARIAAEQNAASVSALETYARYNFYH